MQVARHPWYFVLLVLSMTTMILLLLAPCAAPVFTALVAFHRAWPAELVPGIMMAPRALLAISVLADHTAPVVPPPVLCARLERMTMMIRLPRRAQRVAPGHFVLERVQLVSIAPPGLKITIRTQRRLALIVRLVHFAPVGQRLFKRARPAHTTTTAAQQLNAWSVLLGISARVVQLVN